MKHLKKINEWKLTHSEEWITQEISRVFKSYDLQVDNIEIGLGYEVIIWFSSIGEFPVEIYDILYYISGILKAEGFVWSKNPTPNVKFPLSNSYLFENKT